MTKDCHPYVVCIRMADHMCLPVALDPKENDLWELFAEYSPKAVHIGLHVTHHGGSHGIEPKKCRRDCVSRIYLSLPSMEMVAKVTRDFHGRELEGIGGRRFPLQWERRVNLSEQGKCWICEETGHDRRECPLNTQRTFSHLSGLRTWKSQVFVFSMVELGSEELIRNKKAKRQQKKQEAAEDACELGDLDGMIDGICTLSV
jgi:hypothetical protein